MASDSLRESTNTSMVNPAWPGRDATYPEIRYTRITPEGIQYNAPYVPTELDEYTPSELDIRVDNTEFPDEDQYMRYLQNRVQEAIAEQSQPAQLDPRRDVAGPSTAGTVQDADAVARGLVTSTEFVAAVARHIVETTQQASRPDALPEEVFRGVYELGALGAGGIGLSGVTGVRPTGAAATMFTGRQAALRLAHDLDPTWPVDRQNAQLIPGGIHQLIRQGELAGQADIAIISRVNEIIANTDVRAPFANNRPINEVFGGISRGPDGQWRLEVSDASMRINPSIAERLLRTRVGSLARFPDEVTLGNVVQDSPLFDMYPELANLRVSFQRVHPELEMHGVLMPGPDNKPASIVVGARNADDIKSVLVHEIQHWIQWREGFAGGGMPQRNFSFPDGGNIPTWREFSVVGRLADGRISEARQSIQQLPPWIRDKAEDIIHETISRLVNIRFSGVNSSWTYVPSYTGRTLDDLAKYMKNNPGQFDNQFLMAAAEEIDMTVYRRITGETESRLSQARMDLTGEELRQTPFTTTPDYYTPDQQLFLPETDPGTRTRPVQSMVMPAPPPPGYIRTEESLARPRRIRRDDVGEGSAIRPEDIRIAQERGFIVPNHPVTPEAAEILLNSLGLRVHSIRNANETTYIKFYPPGGENLPITSWPIIRIPSIRRMHPGTMRETEQGVTFDTTWENRVYTNPNQLQSPTERDPSGRPARMPVASHQVDEQGRRYAELDVLREALVRRYRPELAPPSTPDIVPDDPNQFRLFGD